MLDVPVISLHDSSQQPQPTALDPEAHSRRDAMDPVTIAIIVLILL